MSSFIAPSYARESVAFTHGEGIWLFDTAGERYLDALAGVAVNTLGHAHPALTEAIATQASRLIHTSNLYEIPLQEELAEKLCSLSGMNSAFFSTSGAEANEAAIKLTRFYANLHGIKNPGIIVFEKSFHGRTLANVSATGSSKVQKGCSPLMRGFYRAPFNNLAAVKQIIDSTPDIVSIMLETIQGEGGINVASAEFIKGIRKLCDEHELLLILDEVQCGIGRTGDWFAYQENGVLPDILTLAKGLGGGMPIGATLMRGRAEGLFKPGNHGSTFGGSPLACTAALTVIKVIENENLLANAQRIGDILQKALMAELSSTFPVTEKNAIKSVHGRGLMIGVSWQVPLPELSSLALTEKLLINVTRDSIIRILPPLILEEPHINPLIERLTRAILKHPSQSSSA